MALLPVLTWPGLRKTVCIYLNIYVTLCQIEGLVCFLFGIWIINERFLYELSQHISFLNHQYHQMRERQSAGYIFSQYITGQTLLKQELIIAACGLVAVWGTSLLVVFDGSSFDSIFKDIIKIIVVGSDIFDVLRYTPTLVLIALIRIYFKTFSAELTAFRRRHGIITRFEATDEPQVHDSLIRIPIDSAVNNQRREWNISSSLRIPKREHREQRLEHRKSTSAVEQYAVNEMDAFTEYVIMNLKDGSPFVIRLNVTYYEFKNELETIIFPYRRMCRSMRHFFISYLILNTICFALMVVTTIKSITGHECDACIFCADGYHNTYYIHYVTEISVYFLGWVLLMIPLAENHLKIRSLQRDIQAKVVLESQNDQILIHQYLDSIISASPFCVGYLQPTYAKLLWVFNVVIFTVGTHVAALFVSQNGFPV